MSNAQSAAPLVWILKGSQAGDYAQLHLLARAVGAAHVTKQLLFRRWELLLHAFPHPTLAALDRTLSSAFDPPWPDVVLTAGRRNELVARWIQRASRGHARLVHVGRPWSNPACFDLVVSNRQYMLAAADNVIINDLPLTDPADASLADQRAIWGAKWENLPHPWTVVLVGGDSGPLVFAPEKGRELARQVNARIARTGGSVLVSTSGRTPGRSADELLATLHAPAFVYRWPSQDENPYRGLLACGDEFVVTADSMSMLAEACATGKPVYLFDFSDEALGWRARSAYRWKPLVHRLAMSIGPRRMRRDLRRIHHALLDAGRIRRLEAPDDALVMPVTSSSSNDDLARTVERVRALLNR
jgi:mitochondrial fission protein ELM1